MEIKLIGTEQLHNFEVDMGKEYPLLVTAIMSNRPLRFDWKNGHQFRLTPKITDEIVKQIKQHLRND